MLALSRVWSLTKNSAGSLFRLNAKGVKPQFRDLLQVVLIFRGLYHGLNEGTSVGMPSQSNHLLSGALFYNPASL